MAGFSFCRNQRGSACLSGSLSTNVIRGVGYFTELYIRHPGPGFRFEFEFMGMTAWSRPFNVLPPPPRVTGISFSETFSAIEVNFDAGTNLAGMQDSTDCRKIFDHESVLKLGVAASCSWPDSSTLLATLGNNAKLLPGDVLSFTSSAVILTSMRWRPIVLAGGTVSNQRIYAPDTRVMTDTATFALTSVPMPRLQCKSVMLPERVREDTVISGDKDVATADIEHMTIGSSQYLAVANHCLGPNCYFNIEVAFTSASFEIDSIIYEWQTDGNLREHQRIATYGASDLTSFVLDDALSTGGYAPRQFLAVSNQKSNKQSSHKKAATQIWAWDDAIRCALGSKWLKMGNTKPTDGRNLENAKLAEALSHKTEFTKQEWEGFNVRDENGLGIKELRGTDFVKAGDYYFKPSELCPQFVLRQSISTRGGMSVDVLHHNANMYMVMTNTGPESYLTIRRWVAGSFRMDENGANYGWAAGQIFGWVPGMFLEPIQTVPTDGAMRAVLYHAHDQTAMFLAVSNYQSEGSNKVYVNIYRWRETICYENPSAAFLNISCFDKILSLPALGARTVTPFFVEGKNYLAVANHFNGDMDAEQSVHYETDSFIYSVDYTASKESFRLHQVFLAISFCQREPASFLCLLHTKCALFPQALATAGAFSMTVFQHTGAVETATYMSISNLRDSLGLSTISRVYKWTDRRSASWKECASPIGNRHVGLRQRACVQFFVHALKISPSYDDIDARKRDRCAIFCLTLFGRTNGRWCV